MQRLPSRYVSRISRSWKRYQLQGANSCCCSILLANYSRDIRTLLSTPARGFETGYEGLYTGSTTWTRRGNRRILRKGMLCRIIGISMRIGTAQLTNSCITQVAELLDRVSGTVSPAFFLQNVWLVLITAPNSRIPALNYLSRRLPKMQSEDRKSLPSFITCPTPLRNR